MSVEGWIISIELAILVPVAWGILDYFADEIAAFLQRLTDDMRRR